MRLPTRKSACPWCAPSITSGRSKATRRKRLDDMALTSAQTRAASHRPLRRGLQQFMQLLRVELGIAGGEMPARRGAGGGPIGPAVLAAVPRGVGDAGFPRVALLVASLDLHPRALHPF